MYRTLPPGRLRRLSYSDYIRNRRLNSILRNTRIYTQPSSSRIRSLSIIPYSPIVTNINFNYETLSNLQDIKVGLINKNILKNSKIELHVCKLNNDLCVICQDDIMYNDIIRKIKCKHIFHIDCIDKWFSENKRCPTCKYEL